ncbi:hypothetical protein A2U01_0107890, partial [Trifolium medium]|nr:hypothetical protein [Trifolium medium]
MDELGQAYYEKRMRWYEIQKYPRVQLSN